MVQTFQVVRCCECQVFQVEMVKKVAKWQCKVCQVKQSQKQVFARGTGAECRKVVQQFNMQRMEVEGEKEKRLLVAMEDREQEEQDQGWQVWGDDSEEVGQEVGQEVEAKTSRWARFVPQPKAAEVEESEEELFEEVPKVIKRKRKTDKMVLEDKTNSTGVTKSKWGKFSS